MRYDVIRPINSEKRPITGNDAIRQIDDAIRQINDVICPINDAIYCRRIFSLYYIRIPLPGQFHFFPHLSNIVPHWFASCIKMIDSDNGFTACKSHPDYTLADTVSLRTPSRQALYRSQHLERISSKYSKGKSSKPKITPRLTIICRSCPLHIS